MYNFSFYKLVFAICFLFLTGFNQSAVCASYSEDFSTVTTDDWTSYVETDQVKIVDGKVVFTIDLSVTNTDHQFAFFYNPVDMSVDSLYSFDMTSSYAFMMTTAIGNSAAMSGLLSGNAGWDLGIDFLKTDSSKVFSSCHNISNGRKLGIYGADQSNMNVILFTLWTNEPASGTATVTIDNLMMGSSVVPVTSVSDGVVEDLIEPDTSNFRIAEDQFDTVVFDQDKISLWLKDSVYVNQFCYSFDPVDISANPRICVKLKSNTNLVFRNILINKYGQYTAEMIAKSRYIIPSDTSEFAYYYFDYSNGFRNNWGQPIDSTNISSMYFAFVSDSAGYPRKIEIDTIMIGGDVVIPEAEIKGVVEDFDDNDWHGKWHSEGLNNGIFDLEETNGELKVDVNKLKWEKLAFNMGQTVDLTESPFISIDVKATKDLDLRMFLWDHNGRYNDENFVVFPVKASEEYKTYYFDLRNTMREVIWSWNQQKIPVDASKITHLKINFNPGEPYSGTVYLDNLRIGDSATIFENHPPIVAINFPDTIDANLGDYVVDMTGISDGDGDVHSITITGASSPSKIIARPTIEYTAGSTEGTITLSPLSVGQCVITLTLKDDGYLFTNFGNSQTVIKDTIIVIGGYSVIFTVLDEIGNPLPNASIKLGSYGTKITDSEGKVVFEYILAQEDLSYTVTHENYNTIAREINVTNSDVLLNFSMTITGLNNKILNGVTVYPNPTNGEFEVSGLDALKHTTVKVFDITGNLVFTDEIYSDSKKLSLNGKTGLYFIEIKQGSSVITRKIVVH